MPQFGYAIFSAKFDTKTDIVLEKNFVLKVKLFN